MSWCSDCNKETNDYYMVHNHIWYSVARQNEMLCIPCLEKRLHRQLRAYDFTGAPINYDMRKWREWKTPPPRDIRSNLHKLRVNTL